MKIDMRSFAKHAKEMETLYGDGQNFRRLDVKRPTVVRKGDKVLTCHFYDGMKQCLGGRCFWQKVGTCKFFDRLNRKAK